MKGMALTATSETNGRPSRMKIRWATRADAAQLRRIYAYYVENTTVSFEYEAPSVAEMERRIAEVEGVYPFLVCVVEEEDGKDLEDFSVATNITKAQNVLTEENDQDRGDASFLSVVAAEKDAKNRGSAEDAPTLPVAVAEKDAKNRGSAEDASTLPVAVAEKDAKNGGNGEVASTLPPVSDEADVKCVESESVGERVVGYALAHRAFERAAYSWCAETAVYVDRDWRRRGIGEALYSALIAILEAQGIRTLYAVVVAENKASVEFHKRAGYRDFATFKDSGWKFGRWLDVVWLERTLGVWREEEEKREAGEEASTQPVEETLKTERQHPAPTPIRPLADVAKNLRDSVCVDIR